MEYSARVPNIHKMNVRRWERSSPCFGCLIVDQLPLYTSDGDVGCCQQKETFRASSGLRRRPAENASIYVVGKLQMRMK
jgi:hypothetical protein